MTRIQGGDLVTVSGEVREGLHQRVSAGMRREGEGQMPRRQMPQNQPSGCGDERRERP